MAICFSPFAWLRIFFAVLCFCALFIVMPVFAATGDPSGALTIALPSAADPDSDGVTNRNRARGTGEVDERFTWTVSSGSAFGANGNRILFGLKRDTCPTKPTSVSGFSPEFWYNTFDHEDVYTISGTPAASYTGTFPTLKNTFGYNAVSRVSSFSTTDTIPDGTYCLVAWYTTSSDIGVAVSLTSYASLTVTIDSTVAKPTLALTGSVSRPYTDTTPEFTVSNLEAGSTAQLFSDSTCSTSISAVSPVIADGESSVDITVTTALTLTAANTIYAKTVDRAGNTACSDSSFAYQNDIKLSGLTLTSGGSTIPLTPAFATTTTEYAATVGGSVSSMTVTPSFPAGTTTVTYSEYVTTLNGVQVPGGGLLAPKTETLTSGMLSSHIPLYAGHTQGIVVTFTPPPGLGDPPVQYSIDVTRPAIRGDIAPPVDMTAKAGGASTCTIFETPLSYPPKCLRSEYSSAILFNVGDVEAHQRVHFQAKLASERDWYTLPAGSEFVLLQDGSEALAHLRPNTDYDVRAFIVETASDSPDETHGLPTDPIRIRTWDNPSVPTDVYVHDGDAYNGNAISMVSWSPPESVGNPDASITGYSIRYRKIGEGSSVWLNDGGDVGEHIGTNTVHMLAGLTDGDAYAVQVAARSECCQSAWTEALEMKPGSGRQSLLTFVIREITVTETDADQTINLEVLLAQKYHGLYHFSHYTAPAAPPLTDTKSATAGDDYVSNQSAVDFPRGAAATGTLSIPVTIKGDTVREETEAFLVAIRPYEYDNIGNPYLRAWGTVVITILDDDQSDDATLAALTLQAGKDVALTPDFSSAVETYTTSVSYAEGKKFTVHPIPGDRYATVTVNGERVSGTSHRVSLAVGENVIPIVVTADSGTVTKTYTLTVTRGKRPRGGGGVPRLGHGLDYAFGSVNNAYPPLPSPREAASPTTTLIEASDYRGVPVDTAGPSSAGVFSRDIGIGSTGRDVQELQQFLNQNGYLLSSTGPGSPGRETRYFGAKTRETVVRYQQANGITPASGYVGPKTRAFLNSRIASPAVLGVPLPITPSLVTSDFSAQVGATPRLLTVSTPVTPDYPDLATYTLGDRHPTIREAQILLNKTPCKVATFGAGSVGQETDYLGAKTQQAIRCYQQRNNLPLTGTLTDELLSLLRAPNPAPVSQPQPTPQPAQPQEAAQPRRFEDDTNYQPFLINPL